MFATIAPKKLAKSLLPRNLTPASGRQDHTTSPSAARTFVRSAVRVHRIPPRVRDDRDTPLVWDETAEDMQVIWGGRESEYFCQRGWTGGQISGRTGRAVLPSLGSRLTLSASTALPDVRGAPSGRTERTETKAGSVRVNPISEGLACGITLAPRETARSCLWVDAAVHRPNTQMSLE